MSEKKKSVIPVIIIYIQFDVSQLVCDTASLPIGSAVNVRVMVWGIQLCMVSK